MKNKSIITLVAISLIAISSTIDLGTLFNYQNQAIPTYITKDNTGTNSITDEGATLGRVLFYDKKLSVNNTIACASCHKQEFAFGDTATASIGVAGTTGRHSMRLVNTRFSNEAKFFWDERAISLEDQTTKPIQDHIEMGFSNTSGDPDLDSLLRKVASVDYYNELFNFVYGDTVVTEVRLQNALAQFIRSIQSFDSKYDTGRVSAPNENAPFTNFTAQENAGKQLFLAPPQFNANGIRTGGGIGCQGCHQAPEFDIVPNSGNNGVVGSIAGGTDFTNTRSPSLRDVVNGQGVANGPFMHIGISSNLMTVLNHYDSIIVSPGNTTIDPKLVPGGNPQQLQLTTTEKSQLVAFIGTLSGSDIYTNPKWSDPFTNGLITISNTTSVSLIEEKLDFTIYPNPVNDYLNINYPNELSNSNVQIFSTGGRLVVNKAIENRIDLNELTKGIYFIKVGGKTKKFIKQ
jgi:cytochrome c peroxidase